MRVSAAVFSASMVALAIVGVGCDNNNSSSPSGSSFYGMYTDQSGARGTITLTGVAPATSSLLLGSTASVPVTGTLALAGQLPIDLTGLYFTDTGALSFASNDDAYTFTGQVTGASASGTSTGPNGPGSFALITGGTVANVAVFCGDAVCTAPEGCTATATFNLAISGSTAALTVLANGVVVPVGGTRTGDVVSFHVTDKGTDVTITGVINGSNIGGTWADNVNGTSGTWNGNSAQCSTPSR